MKCLQTSIAVFLILAGAVAASGQKVKVETGPGADLGKYKTYARDRGLASANPLINQLIAEAIDRALAERGLTLVSADADIKVVAWTAVDSDLHVSGRSTPIGQMSASGMPGMSQSWDVTNGTLVIDISDTGTKSSIWRATATSVTLQRPTGNKEKDAKNAAKTINKTVEKMFKKYPRPAGDKPR